MTAGVVSLNVISDNIGFVREYFKIYFPPYNLIF